LRLHAGPTDERSADEREEQASESDRHAPLDRAVRACPKAPRQPERESGEEAAEVRPVIDPAAVRRTDERFERHEEDDDDRDAEPDPAKVRRPTATGLLGRKGEQEADET